MGELSQIAFLLQWWFRRDMNMQKQNAPISFEVQIKSDLSLYSLDYAEACNELAGSISASLHPGNTAPFEEKSQRWRAVGNTVSNLTSPRFEPQISRSRDERVTARSTGRYHLRLDNETIKVCWQLKHVVAKVDKWHFSKNEIFIDFNLLTKTNFPEKKIALIFDQFSVIHSLICRTWQQGQIEI